MQYRLKGPLDFVEAPQLKPLLNPLYRNALAAANRGESYREVTEIIDPDTQRHVRVYLKVVYNSSDIPTEIEVGEDLALGFNDSVTTQLREAGVEAVREQAWMTVPLVKRRRSLVEWLNDLLP